VNTLSGSLICGPIRFNGAGCIVGNALPAVAIRQSWKKSTTYLTNCGPICHSGDWALRLSEAEQSIANAQKGGKR
jgi:hypothetical protein